LVTVTETNQYHIPVLVDEVCEALIINPDGVYLDGTLGGGGHAAEILKRLSARALYIGMDRDPEAIEFARKRLNDYSNVIFYHGVFTELEKAMEKANVKELDGVLLDLGISGHQVDDPQRGFTFRTETKLDMRMDPTAQTVTAADILLTYDLRSLSRVFRIYGEERHSHCIARLIVKERESKPVVTSDDLIRIIDRCVPRKHVKKSYARIFQALRIEVNKELEQLREALNLALGKLRKGGRLVVISYHSLEDRAVKQFLRKQENPCECPPELPVCQCGKTPALKRIRPYLILPREEEINNNPRARSAKMRVGEKL